MLSSGLCCLNFVYVTGVQSGRHLLQATPPPQVPTTAAAPPSAGGYGDPGLGGITPAQLPGADYPADVVTCAIMQSAVPGPNSTSASDGVSALYQRGECLSF